MLTLHNTTLVDNILKPGRNNTVPVSPDSPTLVIWCNLYIPLQHGTCIQPIINKHSSTHGVSPDWLLANAESPVPLPYKTS